MTRSPRRAAAALVALIAAALAAACAASGDTAPAATDGDASPATAAESATPFDLVLRERLATPGRVTALTIEIATDEGRLAFPAAQVARVFPSKHDAGRDVLLTVQGDRLAGVVAWEKLGFEDADGPREIRRSHVVELRLPQAPAFPADPVSVTLLGNEDLLVTAEDPRPAGLRDAADVWEAPLLAGPVVRFRFDTRTVVVSDVLRMRLGDASRIGYEFTRSRDRGLRVDEVSPGSPAGLAGWKPGDRIVSLDGRPLKAGKGLGERRDAIRDGTAAYAVIELRRATEPLHFLLER